MTVGDFIKNLQSVQ